jgi:integrase
MRVVGIVAATTGLRIGEVLGPKWKDIDRESYQMEVTRLVEDDVIGKCKTEASTRPAAIDALTAQEFLAWIRPLVQSSSRNDLNRSTIDLSHVATITTHI